MTGHATKSRATSFSYETDVFCPNWSGMLDAGEDRCQVPCAECGHACGEHWPGRKPFEPERQTEDWSCTVAGCKCTELTGEWIDEAT
jgi:hypothetical protein